MATPRQPRTGAPRPARRPAATPATTEMLPSAATPKMLPQPERIKMMWFAVVITMVIIVGAWVLTLFRGTVDRSSSQNPFRDIYEQVKGAFTDDELPAVTPEPADDGRLDELRSRVFPEFTEPSTTP